MTKKELLLATIADSVGNMFYYDRKNDEELSFKDIDNLIENGEISLEEMVDAFSDAIKENYDF